MTAPSIQAYKKCGPPIICITKGSTMNGPMPTISIILMALACKSVSSRLRVGLSDIIFDGIGQKLIVLMQSGYNNINISAFVLCDNDFINYILVLICRLLVLICCPLVLICRPLVLMRRPLVLMGNILVLMDCLFI